MSFTTKKYTRPVLRRAVRGVNVNSFTSFNTFANALSPRAGRNSAQVAALRNILSEQEVALSTVFLKTASAQENKQFLLNLLKNS